MVGWVEAKRIGRSVWNGPFFIGPLSRPVSVGDVLLKVLETFWRGLVAVIAAIALVVAAAYGWSEIGPILFPPLEKQIQATVSFDDGQAPLIDLVPAGAKVTKPFRCDKTHPIKLRFHNGSNVEVMRLSFQVRASRPGFSDNLLRNGYQSTGIHIPAGRTWVGCWTPELINARASSDLEYAVSVIGAYE